MQAERYSGADLEKALRDDTLTSAGAILVGMVKASDKDGHVAFTSSGCEGWVDLPIEMIEDAQRVGEQTCREHSHALVRITLREPKNPEAKVFAAMLSRQPSSAPAPGTAQPMGGMDPGSLQGFPQSDSPDATAFRIGPTFPGQGGFDVGGLGAWGCWKSTCTRCLWYKRVCNGTACWWVCENWTTYPCERCIWPW